MYVERAKSAENAVGLCFSILRMRHSPILADAHVTKNLMHFYFYLFTQVAGMIPTVRVERHSSHWSYPPLIHSSGAARLSFLRAARAHSDRARAARKKDGWLLPIPLTS